jgi:hypothetical protein
MARGLEFGSGEDEPKLKSSVQEARCNPQPFSWETLVSGTYLRSIAWPDLSVRE